MKKIILLILVLHAICVEAQTPLYKDASQPVDARVKDLLARMTAEEKFFQLFMLYGDDNNVD